MDDVVILAALRTPTGRAGGQFRSLTPEQLAAPVLTALLAKSGVDPAAVDEVILGNAVGPGGNLARLCLLAAGLPVTVPGLTVDRQCGGGLEAVRLATALLQSGAAGCVMAGGVESCSQEPVRLGADGRALPRARFAPDHLGDPDMGAAAEDLAAACGIGRPEQDAWAHRSQERALAALAAGAFSAEVVPVPVTETGGGTRLVARDETPRRLLPLAKLAALPPVFRPAGSVTAGNSCRRNDGAAALLLSTAAEAARRGLRPLARVVATAVVGVPPAAPGLGPAAAIRALSARTGIALARVDLFEINEPFAALALACVRDLGLPPERVNPWGGALALGHPYGATGAILLTRLVHGLARTRERYGLAALGIAGGLGMATLVERWPCE